MSHDFLRRAVRGAVVALCLLGGMSTAAFAQIRFGVGIALPGVRIGVNIPAYPDLVPVPGYPVYYAPQLDVNLFFYDGLYWLFTDDEWYSSSWYNGPWYLVPPQQVPDFILRIPVGFYRHPPLFFRYWNRNAPPRWGEHWGPRWRRNRPGWDRWNRRAGPPRAPLPRYQRDFRGGRYPNPNEQRTLQDRYYRFPQRTPQGRPPREQQRYQQQPQQRYREQQRRNQPPPQQRYQEQQRRNQPPPQQRYQEQQRRNQPPPQRKEQQQRREHRPGGPPPG